jgi:hypothetical protein
MSITTISHNQLSASVNIVSGNFEAGKKTLFTICYNEIYLLEAFISHYRSMGVEQFLVLDDHSTDGTFEYLAQQDDCVLIKSKYRYGDVIKVTDGCFNNEDKEQRAGILLKSVIPAKYLEGSWALYADLDEFLILPGGYSSPWDFTNELERDGYGSIISSVVDFYPEHSNGIFKELSLHSTEDLVQAYPYFDVGPTLRIDGQRAIEPLKDTSTVRLLHDFEILKKKKRLLEFLTRFYNKKSRRITTVHYKTPFVKFDTGVIYHGSHKSSATHPLNKYWCLAHFKFNYSLSKKTEFAVKSKSYSKNSFKYSLYEQLQVKLQQDPSSLISTASRKFTSTEDLVHAGHLKWF